jgi:mono/diheme cytochrome c family protein
VSNLFGLFLIATVTQSVLADRPLPELRQLYVQHCARCHGLDGSATSPEGRLKGLDFTSARDMKGRTDQDLANSIASGVFFGLKMPAFRTVFSEAEIQLLVRDILRKAQKGKAIAPAPAPAPAPDR